jgi:glycosyltransferase involved in cell wall biosynthesis
MEFHILSFEGPDAYSQVGGLATRMNGLCQALADMGFETHFWFIGDPELPGHESKDHLHLHRWGQWLSRHHRGGVYDGEYEKARDYAGSLPPFLLYNVLAHHLVRGGHGVILAEEWQTVDAVLHLDHLLRRDGLRDLVTIFWNANNTFGFDQIDWGRLSDAAFVTTVSRYMKHQMRAWGQDPVVIPNGLSPDAFRPPDWGAVAALRRRFRDQVVLTKMARWDPAKRWLESVQIVADLKRRRLQPVLIARGGTEPHGSEVIGAARDAGLRVVDCENPEGTIPGMLQGLDLVSDADVLNLRWHVDPDSRRVLFRASDVVLANSSHEPFGLVGLEAMAVGGIACTGCSGEDYAVCGRNALVLQTGDPGEFVELFRSLQNNPSQVAGMRRAGRRTARELAWPEVIRKDFLPRVELSRAGRPARLVPRIPAPGEPEPEETAPSPARAHR